MGLTQQLLGLATRRPRCYVVEAPGGASQRMAVERELDARGWRPAWSPASADVLVVCGELLPELAQAADLLWSQLPGPRARMTVTDPGEAGAGLDEVRRQLTDDPAQRRAARERDRDEVSPRLASHGDMDHGEMDHGEMDHGEMDHGDMDHGDMDHGDMDHGDMDHGDMEMAPGGIALAEGADDRDGLEMDVLTHPLGPLLDRWPGGLELRLTLHGDVVGDASARRWGSREQDRPFQVAAWDAVATTLSLAGDERGAHAARGIRAAMIDEVEVPTGSAARLRTRVARLAAWSVVPDSVATTLLDLTSEADHAPRPTLRVGELVRGRDLADVRLLIASHSPLLATDEHEAAARD